MLTIDGSHGEGGGQVLRTSLGLSMLTGTPFRMERVRANRDKPGLMRQHLTAVLAAAELCSAEVTGAAIGSSELSFRPNTVRPGDYTFSVGTSGSTSLVFQAILPGLLTTGAPSTITLQGGTHNIYAPPVDFLDKTFLSIVNRMGPAIEVALERHGFYPAGGGQWIASVAPAAQLSPIHLGQRGDIVHHRCAALVAGLPVDIAERELAVCRKAFDWPQDAFQVLQLPDALGPGNVLMIEIGDGNVTEVFTAFGQRGVRAEAVAQQCVAEAQAYLGSKAAVGEHLADQLLIPLAIAGGGSYLTMPPTLHTQTNIEIVQRFLPVKIEMTEVERQLWRIEVRR